MRINRRKFITAAVSSFSLAHSQAAAPPNVIILLTDDQGYGDLSVHGNPVLRTPWLDKLHSESVRFTSFHAAPMCTPTRGQLLTGQDALRNGATSVTAGRAVIRRGIPLMSDIFAANGYATGLFGKWHVGDNYPYRPMDRGFQEAQYFLGWGFSSAPEFDNDYFNGRYRHNGVPKRFAGYCTDFWFDQAMEWMRQKQRRRERFFCYLPTNTPHGPAWVAPKYAEPYNKAGLPANFFGMIANLDENVGKLRKFLDESGLAENTILIFTTDNGGTAGVNTFNAGMRGRKTQVYEGGHRVPFFLRWPGGKLGQPRDIGTPAQMQDVLPTLIELCRLKKPPEARFDGVSLAGLLTGREKALADRMMVVQYGQILNKWDATVIWGKYRLVKGEELYDLEADPGETSNIAAQNAAVFQRMREHYEQWWAGVEPKLRDFSPISIGSEKENPVALSCSDWQEVYCDNANAVLSGAGGPRGGPWNVFVERDGEYEIALRRWKIELDLPLDAPRPEQKMTVGSLSAGKAIPIRAARLTIAGQDLSAKTAAGEKAAVFRVKLKGSQKTQLHGWFQDQAGADLCGAYYAYVRRV